MDALGRVRAQAIVLLVLAFLAGAFAGGATERVVLRPSRGARPMRWFSRGSGPGAERGGPARGPGARGGGGLPAFYDGLGLTTDQRTKIGEIARKRSARVDSVRRSTWDVISAAQDSTRREIDVVLTPEQRLKLDSLRPRGRGGFAAPGMRGPRGGQTPTDVKRP